MLNLIGRRTPAWCVNGIPVRDLRYNVPSSAIETTFGSQSPSYQLHHHRDLVVQLKEHSRGSLHGSEGRCHLPCLDLSLRPGHPPLPKPATGGLDSAQGSHSDLEDHSSRRAGTNTHNRTAVEVDKNRVERDACALVNSNAPIEFEHLHPTECFNSPWHG